MLGRPHQEGHTFRDVLQIITELQEFDQIPELLTGAKRREWMGMGVAGMIITSDDWDHSRKFPTKHQ
jgi:hypothetical protein